MKSAWEWVTSAVAKLPGWLKRILQTTGGKYLAGMLIAQAARRVPFLQSIPPAQVLDILNSILDSSTAAMGVMGTIHAPSMKQEMAASDPDLAHAVTPDDAPRLKTIVLNGKIVPVKLWKVDSNRALVAVIEDDSEVQIPLASASESQLRLHQQLISQMRG